MIWVFLIPLGWLVASVVLMISLEVFAPQPLRRAPQRISALSIVHVGGIVLLYYVAVATAIALLTLTSAASPPAATAPAVATTVPATAPAGGPAGLGLITLLSVDGVIRMSLAGLILFMASRLVVGGIGRFGMSLRQIPAGVWAGCVAFFVSMPVIYLVSIATKLVSDQIRSTPVPPHEILLALGKVPSAAEMVVLVLSAVVIAPFAEEVLFRGLLQTVLLQWGLRPAHGEEAVAGDRGFDGTLAYESPPQGRRVRPAWRWVTILLASLVFALVHLNMTALVTGNWSMLNPEVLPVLLVLSIALGYVYERTGNLWSAIVLHMLFNATSTALVLSGAASP